MKIARIFLFFIIGIAILMGAFWFFQRGTPSQEVTKVYKTAPTSNPPEGQLPTGISPNTDSHTQVRGETHDHAEKSPHTQSPKRPSDSMVRIVRESYAANPELVNERWLAYVESEEGRAFFDGYPTPDEWFEKSQSFGFFQKTPESQRVTDHWYRQHFPTGTVDENEPIIRDIMREAILENELQKEEHFSQTRNLDVLRELLLENEPYAAWGQKKFGFEPPSSRDSLYSTFEEIRLAERAKYLGTDQNEPSASVNDATDVAVELPLQETQPPANTPDVSDDGLRVEGVRVEGTTPQQTGVEPPTSTEQVSPDIPTAKTLETALRTQFSPERFTRAMNTLNQYGPVEGLRRLKASDPEVAKQVEHLFPKQQEND